MKTDGAVLLLESVSRGAQTNSFEAEEGQTEGKSGKRVNF